MAAIPPTPPGYEQALQIINNSNLSQSERAMLLGYCIGKADAYASLVHACAASPDVNKTLRSVISMYLRLYSFT